MIRRLLIANRGEIACRIIESCRRLGVHSIAVYSEADRHARHVRMADEAWPIGAAPARESYLNIDKVLEAARHSRADAIHPGYGFLSENAGFAEACHAAGIIFVGPPASAMRAMGLKHEAKAIVAAAGVPVVPGYLGEDQSPAALRREAHRIGYPVLIKAVAGGGGKGMRIVHEDAQFDEAATGARSEAENAFGDGRLLLEKFLERPRHIEVQVFADTHGNTVHLFERECSVQRRYQKIIEESPSPFLDAATREAMTGAAVRAAQAVGYINAGTIEFIVGNDGAFYFMEMNTRLQVEHPVTERVTGLDLVEWQLRVASGEPLPCRQEDIHQCGHAIEVRLYSEDARRGFLPSTGRIEKFATASTGDDWRVDSGVEDGDEVSVHYDPMVAKLIASGPNRQLALQRLRQGLDATAVFGVTTNLPLLRVLAAHPAFIAGEVDTSFVDRELEALTRAQPLPAEVLLLAAHLGLAGMTDASEAAASPWSAADGWRISGAEPLAIGLRAPEFQRLRVVQAGALLQVQSSQASVRGEVTVLDEGHYCVDAGSGPRTITALQCGQQLHLCAEQAWDVELTTAWPFLRSADDADTHPASPLPGRVVSMRVSVGETVEKGQVLAVVEGMKMQHAIRASRAGTIAEVLAVEGELVEAEAILFEIDAT